MNYPRLTQISFTDTQVIGHFTDGRMVGCPLSWFPRLQNADSKLRNHYTLSANGIGAHWPDLDEDLSAEGFFTYTPQKVSV